MCEESNAIMSIPLCGAADLVWITEKSMGTGDLMHPRALFFLSVSDVYSVCVR